MPRPCEMYHHFQADNTQFISSYLLENFYSIERAFAEVFSWRSAYFFMLNLAKTDFLLVALAKQLSKIENRFLLMNSTVTLSYISSARSLGVLPYLNLSLSVHIYSISKSCIFILGTLGARNIATAVIHLNSNFVNLPANQFSNKLFSAVSKFFSRAATHILKFHHVTPTLKSLQFIHFVLL
jgi:hypothetical protein